MSKTVVALWVCIAVFAVALPVTLGAAWLLQVLERDLSVPRYLLVIAAVLAGGTILFVSAGRSSFRRACQRQFDGLVGQQVAALLSLPALDLCLRLFVIASGCIVLWQGLILVR